MKKNITNHKYLVLAVTMAVVLALAGCSKATKTKNTVTEKEAVLEKESSESVESTEDYVPDTEPETTENEPTETESETESAKVSETENTNIENEAGPKAENMNYTFADMSTTMYAKSSVNVRELPSTDGTKVGALAKNQEVTVTGKCNETGWYRIAYNDGEAYVSNNYLNDTAVTDNSTSVGTNTTVASTNSTGIVDQNDSNIWTPPHEGMIYDATEGKWIDVPADGFNRAAAEEVWQYMNAERTAAGLNEIAWDEDIYNFACQRAQAIVNDFSHSGHGGYSENIHMHGTYNGYSADTGYLVHSSWYHSSGHHANYMNAKHTKGACAVYVYNGAVYAVENFTNENSAVHTTREYNGQTLSITAKQAEAFDNGNIWTASNGVVVFIESNGNVSAGDGIHSLEELQSAVEEYYSCH